MSRLAEHHAVAPERAPTWPIVDQAESPNPPLITSAMTIFAGTPNWPRLKKKGGGKSMTASTPPGRNESATAGIDARGVGRGDTRGAARSRRSSSAAIRSRCRTLRRPSHCRAWPRRPPREAARRPGSISVEKTCPLGPTSLQGQGQFTFAGADVCHHRARLNGEHVFELRTFAAVDAKAKPAPLASRAHG